MTDARASRRVREDVRVGALLAVLAVAVSATQIFWHHFVDDDDTVAIGLLIARGAVLYRDVFTNHFPFPYYWVAAALRLSGPSMAGARLSVVVFQATCVACAMWTTTLFTTVGVAALLWSVVGHYYLGNLALYYTFKGAALFVTFTTTVAITTGRVRPDPRRMMTLGVFAAIALLSDPFAVYPVVVALAAIAVAGGTRVLRAAWLSMAACLAAYAAYLLLTGSWADFIHDAIRFNTDVYARVTPGGPLRLAEAARVALRVLDLFDGRWMHVDPFARPETLTYPDRWLFTGFAFRLAIVTATAALLYRRRPLAAAFVYISSAVLLVTRYGEFFYAIPFVMAASFGAAAVITGAVAALPSRRGGRVPGLGIAWRTGRVATAVLIAWLAVRGATDIVRDRSQLSYSANFYGREDRARTLSALSCNRTDVALAYYPFDPSMYFFSGLRPASRYLFFVPWTVDRGRAEVVRSLEHAPAIVYLDLHGDIWGHANREYLQPVLELVRARYEQLDPELYRSPHIGDRCPFTYRWDAGCSDAEGSPDQNWRWCSSAATLYLYNGTGEERTVTIDMAVGTSSTGRSTLRIETPWSSELIAIDAAAVPLGRTLVVPPGNHPVRLTSDASPAAASTPDRPLVFRIVNFRVTERASAAAPGDAPVAARDATLP